MYGKPTISSARRASLVDEKKRKERVEKERINQAKVCSTTAMKVDTKLQNKSKLQTKCDIQCSESALQNKDFKLPVAHNATKNEALSINEMKNKNDKDYDHTKYAGTGEKRKDGDLSGAQERGKVADRVQGRGGVSSKIQERSGVAGGAQGRGGATSKTQERREVAGGAHDKGGVAGGAHGRGEVAGGAHDRGGVSGGAHGSAVHASKAGTGGSTNGGILPDHHHMKPTSHDTGAYGYKKNLQPVIYPDDQYGYKKLSAAEKRRYHDNVDFYKNDIRSKPLPGHKIEDMLKWKGNYEKLERNHQYIQWLFPIPESNGLNMYAQQLFEHEAIAIKGDDKAQKRVLKAYRMMLDFYGMELADSIHGVVKRAGKGWQDRYEHLNRSRHNLLRITRILKSIGELGYERFQARWVDFLIDEAVINHTLPNLNGPCLMHWVMAVKDDGEREMLYRKANGLPINQDNTYYGSNSESEDDNDEEKDLETDGHSDPGDLELPTELDNLKLIIHDSKSVQSADKQLKQVESQTVADQCKDKSESMIHSPTSKPQMVKPVDGHIKDQQKYSEASALGKQSNVAERNKSDAMLGAKPKTIKQDGEELKDKSNKRHTDLKAPTCDMVRRENNLPSDNLKFYQNNLLSRPGPGYVIESMLKYEGEYDFFDEQYPGFIQWLFPIPESVGRNVEAQALYKHEAEEIRNTDELRNRVLKAFKMMLDYFGMELQDDVVGKFGRKKNTYKKRYEYLEKYPINFLRISRIIKSIGELGFERFQVPWVEFLIEEGTRNKHFPVLDGQVLEYWIGAIRDEEEKHAMVIKYGKELQYRVACQSMVNNFDSPYTGEISVFPFSSSEEIARLMP